MLKQEEEKEKAVWIPDYLMAKITFLAKVKEGETIKDYIKKVLERHIEQYAEIFDMMGLDGKDDSKDDRE